MGRLNVATKCLTPEELLAAALGRERTNSALSRHLEQCAACRESVRADRETLSLLHAAPSASRDPACLDDHEIAALVDGGLTAGPGVFAHVAGCANCRARLADIAAVMADSSVAAELEVLRTSPKLIRDGWSRRKFAVSGLAAAAAAIVLLGPARLEMNRNQESSKSEARREIAITVAPAPRIITEGELVSLTDSLRWTTVSEADLYRVQIWNHDGTVVWRTDTRATAVVIPSIIQSGTSYLWSVQARIGWERWVSSDFVEFTTRLPASR